LDSSYIKYIIESKYGLRVNALEKIKNVYRVKTTEKDYCLKVIKYNFNHFIFIIEAIKHLQNNGFQRIPKMIKTVDGMDFIELEGNFAYLTVWIDARESNYDNPIDMVTASRKLAELHDKSMGFQVDRRMEPRVGWFKWLENFITRSNEILDFKRRIAAKPYMSEFDYMYLDAMEEELQRIENSVVHLSDSEYLEKMEKEIEKRGFCHHDYAHHNVLIEPNKEVNIIDFDYCILDSHLHDLSSLMIRTMKNGKWDLNTALYILDAYSSIYPIEEEDIPIMSAFVEFPQDYWQVGIQYYWEHQPWGEEFFVNKLKRILDDREERQEFVEDFSSVKYNG